MVKFDNSGNPLIQDWQKAETWRDRLAAITNHYVATKLIKPIKL